MKKIQKLFFPAGDTRLGVRLTLCFVLLIATLIWVAGLSLRQLRILDSELTEIVDKNWSKVELSRLAQSYSNQNNRITMLLFLLDDERERKSLRIQRELNSHEVSRLIQVLSERVESNNERELLEAVKQKRVLYVNSYKNALQILDQNHPDVARNLLIKEVLPLINDYHSAWDAYVTYQGRQMNLAQTNETTTTSTLRKTSFLLISLEVLLTAAIGLFVIRTIAVHIQTRKRSEGLL